MVMMEVYIMAYSDAQKRATRKYRDAHYDQMNLQIPKGQREVYRAQAAAHGLSLNAYIISLLEADRQGGSAPPALDDDQRGAE